MQRTPAQVYCIVFGVTLIVVGVIGFFAESSFAVGDDAPRGEFIGIFDVNGWHNLVHTASGIAALAFAGSSRGARVFAIGFGAVYAALTLLGLAYGDGSSIFGLVPIDTADNFLHLGIALVGIVAGVMSPEEPEPRPQ